MTLVNVVSACLKVQSSLNWSLWFLCCLSLICPFVSSQSDLLKKWIQLGRLSDSASWASWFQFRSWSHGRGIEPWAGLWAPCSAQSLHVILSLSLPASCPPPPPQNKSLKKSAFVTFCLNFVFKISQASVASSKIHTLPLPVRRPAWSDPGLAHYASVMSALSEFTKCKGLFPAGFSAYCLFSLKCFLCGWLFLYVTA